MFKVIQKLITINNIASCICTLYNNGKANVMMIDSVIVEKEHRNKGVGTSLLHEAIEYAKSMNVDSIELVVNNDNYPAIHLYEKLDFIEVPKKYYRRILQKNE